MDDGGRQILEKALTGQPVGESSAAAHTLKEASDATAKLHSRLRFDPVAPVEI